MSSKHTQTSALLSVSDSVSLVVSKMANRLDDDQTSLLTGMHELLMRRGTESGEPVYSPSVSHGCFRSVDNYNRLTPPQVSAVIRQYQRDVREAQQLL